MASLKILIIDDDPDIVEAMRMPLEANDYEVISANCGKEGLQKARDEIPDDLDIIMTNLIGNAIKYTREGGSINIKNIIADNEIKVEVSDTGIGIHKDDMNKIFDEFYRAKNAKDIEHDGTGLGLPIVKNLVKRNGGNIDLQSILGKGTTFTVSFPAVT